LYSPFGNEICRIEGLNSYIVDEVDPTEEENYLVALDEPEKPDYLRSEITIIFYEEEDAGSPVLGEGAVIRGSDQNKVSTLSRLADECLDSGS
jgi:hypothetical protein